MATPAGRKKDKNRRKEKFKLQLDDEAKICNLFLANCYLLTGTFSRGRREIRGGEEGRKENKNTRTIRQQREGGELKVSVGYGISLPGRKGKNNRVQEITQQAREEKEGSWRSGRRGVEGFNLEMKEARSYRQTRKRRGKEIWKVWAKDLGKGRKEMKTL
ncbi:Uncharacterized protein Fot_20625 [Forsythia ovata]|uniref:Uncharacterized protein n=1 Tax=Forsythia ovata TaxID=205694 RepID=A0ABD1USI7_9LAMI